MVPDNIRYPKPEEPAWTGYAHSRYRIPRGAIELSRISDGNYWVHIHREPVTSRSRVTNGL
jgi:hypothetical protein